MKCFLKKLLSHEIFRSMVSWTTNFFVEKFVKPSAPPFYIFNVRSHNIPQKVVSITILQHHIKIREKKKYEKIDRNVTKCKKLVKKCLWFLVWWTSWSTERSCRVWFVFWDVRSQKSLRQKYVIKQCVLHPLIFAFVFTFQILFRGI